MRWGLRRMRVEDGGGEVWEKVEDQVGGEKTGGGGRWTERGQEAQHHSERKMKVCVCTSLCVCVRVSLIVRRR